MNEKTSAHFDEEALVRWQMGDAAEAERDHLAGCADCQARTRSLADSLSWFGAAARQWGEEKAVASENLWERKPATSMNWRGMVAAWAMVSVALLLVFGIGLQRWEAHRAAIEAQVQQRQQQQEKQELARDNALLEEVDQDVSQVVPESMQPLSWNAANNGPVSATNSTAARQ
jgi:hypothetical protein